MRNRWFILKSLFELILIGVIVLYPILISIYVFLPLFIGFAGWSLLRGIDGKGLGYIFFPLVYLINLEINLSLPLLMVVFATLLYYLTLYDYVRVFKKCRMCVIVLSVVLIDLYYLGALLVYDALMDTNSIVIDKLLWYSLLSDIFMAVL